jgi:hypothetical protein
MTTATRDDSGGALARVTDLRGRSAATADPMLVDPTGRRARRLRLGGRLLAAVLTIWLCALVLAGLGAFPVDLPHLGATRVGQPAPKVRLAPDGHSSHATVSPRRVFAERRAQAGSGLRQSRTTAPGTNHSSSATHRSVARTPDARARHVAKREPSSVTSTSGSRRAPPAAGGPAQTSAPASPSRTPSGSSGASAGAPGRQGGSTGSSGASAGAPGHQSGSTGSSGASATAPGHQIGSTGSSGASAPGHQSSPDGSPSAPGGRTSTTSSTGPRASRSASDHGAGRTTGSGTPPG